MKRAFVVLIAAATSACANQAAQPAPTAPPAESAVAESARPARLWNVERETCAELLAAGHEDRAFAAMFYYGYVAARAGIRVIDGAQVEARVRRAVAECEANPGSPIRDAFQRALVPRRAAPTRT